MRRLAARMTLAAMLVGAMALSFGPAHAGGQCGDPNPDCAVVITTIANSALVSAPGEVDDVAGVTNVDGSAVAANGVSSVVVTLTNTTTLTSVSANATLTCGDPGECTWSARIPFPADLGASSVTAVVTEAGGFTDSDTSQVIVL